MPGKCRICDRQLDHYTGVCHFCTNTEAPQDQNIPAVFKEDGRGINPTAAFFVFLAGLLLAVFLVGKGYDFGGLVNVSAQEGDKVPDKPARSRRR